MYALVMQNGPREETGFVPGFYIPKMPSFHTGLRISNLDRDIIMRR